MLPFSESALKMYHFMAHLPPVQGSVTSRGKKEIANMNPDITHKITNRGALFDPRTTHRMVAPREATLHHTEFLTKNGLGSRVTSMCVYLVTEYDVA
jgi:hypothetical protein